MSEDSLAIKAVESAARSNYFYCKFLSANDSGETGGHQVGILISKNASRYLFGSINLKEHHILKKDITIKWQDDFATCSCFTWYESKGELRITRFGRGFPLLVPEHTGALFILVKLTEEDYEAFILNLEDDILYFLETFGLTPAETNQLVSGSRISPKIKEQSIVDGFINGLTVDFPASTEMSSMARAIQEVVYCDKGIPDISLDQLLLDWTEREYQLFKAIEYSRYSPIISNGFTSVEEFISFANIVLNRRKSRAGKGLEHHLAAIFDMNQIRYDAQKVTEGNKRPDFVFPSMQDYHNFSFDVDKLCTLAAKTTCKDRWRQVLNEADRLRDKNKYLCTMQQGISRAQLDEMDAERVILVVPRPYISAYPKDRQHRIWTVSKFVDYIKELEGIE